MKTSSEWWRSTANHMWRSYFLMRSGIESATTESEKLIYSICDRVFTDEFVKSDQDIVQMYFTSRWGDDLYAVEDYSLKHNIPVKIIWIVIKRASRSVIEHIGLLDRKEE